MFQDLAVFPIAIATKNLQKKQAELEQVINKLIIANQKLQLELKKLKPRQKKKKSK